MTAFFTLWDIRTGNFLYEFEDGAEALLAAAELIDRNPRFYPDTLLLRWTDATGTPEDIACGPALAALAASVSNRAFVAAAGE